MTSKSALLTAEDRTRIDELVLHYEKNGPVVKGMLDQVKNAVFNRPTLMRYVHSTKDRLKDSKRLKDKLERKLLVARANGKVFPITENNLLYKLNDLAGFRILHLHTEQIVDIDRELRAAFDEYRLLFHEEPKARTWDDESRQFFESVGIKTIKSPSMYTSVHYVVKANTRTRVTCEIQVRTLAEELWGEVDHTLNYPHSCSVAACVDQIKVLARVTSSCSRLVDSIFRSARSDTKSPTPR